jgi:hypothetical protein
MARIADTYIRLRLDAEEEFPKEVMRFFYQRGFVTYFLGKLFKKVGRAWSPVGRALGGILKRGAKRALITVGHTLTRIGGLGRPLGEKLVEAAGRLFGL